MMLLANPARAVASSRMSRRNCCWAPCRNFCSFTPPLESEIMLGLIAGFLPRMERTFMTKQATIAVVTLFFCAAVLHAQQPATIPAPLATQQRESDEYTRYELLPPETASSKIAY